ncbi:MAG: hypothetical protein Q9195_002571 [Heterodermia aff. obscurata]
MFATCHAPIWNIDDFSDCFHRDFLQTIFPLAATGASLLYIAIRWLSQNTSDGQNQKNHIDLTIPVQDGKQQPHHQLAVPEIPRPYPAHDEEGEVENLPHTAGITIEVNHPRGEKALIFLESLAVIGELCIHSIAWSTHTWGSSHDLVPIAGISTWGYILVLLGLRAYNSRTPVVTIPNLWNQTAVLYSVQWVLAVLIFRSSLVHPRHSREQQLTIANFTFTTVLLLIALTSRKGNKPVILEYEGTLEPSREPMASLFSLATFSWVDPIVWRGYKKTFEMEDLWNLAPKNKAAVVLADYRQFMKTTKLAWHLLRYFKYGLLIQGAWAVCNGFFTFVPTLLLKAILEYVENPQVIPVNTAYFYVVLLACSSIAEGVTNGQGLWVGRKICIRLRAVVVGEIYAKALRRKAASATDKALGDEPKSNDEGKAKKRTKSSFPSFRRRKKAEPSPQNALPVAGNSDSQVNSGTIINLMAVDSFKMADICSYLHFLWGSSPVQLIVCIVLLYRVLGYTSFVSIAIMVLAMPLNYYIAQQFAKTQKGVMAATDNRIHTTNEVLQNVRIIKYFAWEQRFGAIVDEKRRAELQALRTKYVLWTFAAGVWFGIPLVIAFFSFMLYTVVEKKPLIPSVAFTALSLFGILRIPLDQLADMIAHVQEAKVSVDRIEEFLNEDETEKYDQLLQYKQDERGDPIIGFDRATLSWGGKGSSRKDGSTAFRLIGMDIKFRVGALNIVAGPTGSGKTSLLMALLGEMTLLEGSVSIPGGHSREELRINPESGFTESVAYCAQQAWLVNDTIKENIVFASPFDKLRYKNVISACALERDLEILDAGDATLVGEKGIALSGGQKQRISLARALYCNSRHVLLDDCLSAVDSHTAKHIFEQCIMGPLMLGRTCILVTHNVALCVPFSQHIVILANGKVALQGPPDDVISSGLLGDDVTRSKVTSRDGTRSHSRNHSRNPSDDKTVEGVVKGMNGHAQTPNGHAAEPQNGVVIKTSNKDTNANARTEGKTTGRVKFSVMKLYLTAMGPWYFWIFAFTLFAGQQIASVTTTIWIRQWSNSYTINDDSYRDIKQTPLTSNQAIGPSQHILTACLNSGTCAWKLAPISKAPIGFYTDTMGLSPAEVDISYYLGVYALLGIIYIVVSMGREGLMFFGSLNASRQLHSRLLVSVTRAKFKFFDSTPLGQLMNRFSKDLEAIDQEVAPIALGLLGCLSTVFCIVILISIITPRFLIAAVFISVIYFAIGKFYLSSSTDLKRLESVQRSPLYQQFGETLSGVTTIRAYGDERRFIRDNQLRIDTQTRPFLYLWAANRWLALRIDVTGALVSFFAGVFIILSVGKIDAGAAGLSLTYAVTFTENVLWLVRLYSNNEQNMNSVERVKEYLDVEQEAKAIIPDCRPDGNWPSQGNVDFVDYSTRYRADLKPVLSNVTFRIKAGERVGIVGRTGAGKSSLALALFRGLEADSGKIIIDGVDISLIGLQDLREAITIVPQDPTLFTGTLRSNLDPFGLFTDEEVFTILRQVQLIDAPSPSASSENHPPETHGAPNVVPYFDSSDEGNGDDLTKKMTNSHENANIFTDLSSPIAESGSNLSQGQRQLLCLARALLKSPRVLMMDEATASIDYATDAKIQETLRAVKGSTIITIAHRLQTIVDYDKVLVLDKGEVVEYDAPWELLSKEDSTFRGMCEMSGDLDILVDGAKQAERNSKLIDV